MNGMTETDRQGVIAKLNTIMETEQAGVVCTSCERAWNTRRRRWLRTTHCWISPAASPSCWRTTRAR